MHGGQQALSDSVGKQKRKTLDLQWLGLSVCVSVYLSVYLSVHLSVYLSICLSVCLSVRLSVVDIAAWRPIHEVTELHMHASTSQQFGTCAPGCREAGEWKTPSVTLQSDSFADLTQPSFQCAQLRRSEERIVKDMLNTGMILAPWQETVTCLCK